MTAIITWIGFLGVVFIVIHGVVSAVILHGENNAAAGYMCALEDFVKRDVATSAEEAKRRVKIYRQERGL